MEKLLNTFKHTLVTVNLFYLTSGVILLYLGTSVQVMMDTFTIVGWNFYVPWYYIGVGIFIVLVAALGFYGAIKENHLISILFAVAMFLTFILQLSGCIAGFITKNFVYYDLDFYIARYSNDYEVRMQWDLIHERFQCCGNVNPSDFLILSKDSENTLQLPISCCPRLRVYYEPLVCTIENAYTRGCGDVFMSFANSQMDYLWYSGAFLTLIQGLIIVAVVSAMLMVKAAREDKKSAPRR